MTAGDIQNLGQLSEVPGHLLQQQFEAVPNNMNLLLGFQAVAALRVDQQLEGHVLKGGDLQLGIQELPSDLLWELVSVRRDEGLVALWSSR